MNPRPGRAWLFTTTSPEDIYSGYGSIQAGKDLVIAVDAGLKRVHTLGLTPGLIIGDMDSVDAGLLELYCACQQLRHPAMKNETDTELALNWCLEAEIGEIIICNGLGGRFDHSLALIQNLEYIYAKGATGSIESATQKIWFLEPDTRIAGCKGCLLSLLAWGQEAAFTSSYGLQYPLDDICLQPGRVRGVSNLIMQNEAFIRLDRGIILAILTKASTNLFD